MIDLMEEPIFYEDEVDYCTIDGEHCHVFSDKYDTIGVCVPLHGPDDGCADCRERYN